MQQHELSSSQGCSLQCPNRSGFRNPPTKSDTAGQLVLLRLSRIRVVVVAVDVANQQPSASLPSQILPYNFEAAQHCAYKHCKGSMSSDPRDIVVMGLPRPDLTVAAHVPTLAVIRTVGRVTPLRLADEAAHVGGYPKRLATSHLQSEPWIEETRRKIFI